MLHVNGEYPNGLEKSLSVKDNVFASDWFLTSLNLVTISRYGNWTKTTVLGCFVFIVQYVGHL